MVCEDREHGLGGARVTFAGGVGLTLEYREQNNANQHRPRLLLLNHFCVDQ